MVKIHNGMPISADSYMEAVMELAKWPHAGESVEFRQPVLGMFGEMIEYAENQVPDELGDILYYLVAYVFEHGKDLAEIIATSEYVPMTDPLIPLGKIAEAEKKRFRTGGELSKARVFSIDINLALIVKWLVEEAKTYDLTLYDVMVNNLVKLEDRLQRGVLHSEGSER